MSEDKRPRELLECGRASGVIDTEHLSMNDKATMLRLWGKGWGKHFRRFLLANGYREIK